MAHSLKLGAQGRLVLPAAMRRSVGLEPGDEIAARVEGRRIVLESPDDLLLAMQEELGVARAGSSLVEELIVERRAEAEREQQD